MWMVSWYRTVLDGAPEDALNAAASALAPGSNGLLTVPDWLAPTGAAWRRGALLGFDGSQGRAHIYPSLLAGIALTLAHNTAAMEQALRRPGLHALGAAEREGPGGVAGAAGWCRPVPRRARPPRPGRRRRPATSAVRARPCWRAGNGTPGTARRPRPWPGSAARRRVP